VAARTFLSEEELTEALKRLKEIPFPRLKSTLKTGSDYYKHQAKIKNLRAYLSQCLEEKLKPNKTWHLAKPILLGSWARGEIAPKSDIDLLFLGEEEKVSELVQEMQKAGVKIRARVPESLSDWAIGVEPFDILALLGARALASDESENLEIQKIRILQNKKQLHDIQKAMLKERAARAERYDSIANYLEPNIKFGPGGLRDIEQGLAMKLIKPKAFQGAESTINRLEDLKNALLILRDALHLHGYQDILVADAQVELSRFFEFKSVREFMTEVQFILTESSFYAEWMVKKALVKSKPLKIKNNLSYIEAMRVLKKDSSIITQAEIKGASIKVKNIKEIGQALSKIFTVKSNEFFLEAIYHSGLLALAVPALKTVAGLVQHDQYHRLSVDAHTFQAVREVLRVYKNPKRLGKLAKIVKALSKKDWQILIWSALYHDLGKGKDGDHASIGFKLVQNDFKNFGFSKALTDEVSWLVKNHLVLSGAAFRQNPNSPTTWKWLLERGVKDKRTHRLTIFTAIDIRATNMDAWTPWKEALLLDLNRALSSEAALKMRDWQMPVRREFLQHLDSRLIESLPKKLLAKDLKALTAQKLELEPLIHRSRLGYMWVRFHARTDRPGLFLKYVSALHRAGTNIIEAFAISDEAYGVYDWFLIKVSKNEVLLKKLLDIEILKSDIPKAPKIHFSTVELIREDKDSAILSFRGKDERGALFAAAQSLYDHGLSIVWARVNTWGRQIDDVFCVRGDKKIIDSFINKQQKNVLNN
jgi:[protein-PII] uridylyltransferase